VSASRWVLLSYRLPREPSTPRISLWRSVKALGAAQIVDGLVALPSSPRNQERFEWLAEDVREGGGDAAVWTGATLSGAEERSLVTSMRSTVAQEYADLVHRARVARRGPHGGKKRIAKALRSDLLRIRQRDYFGSDGADVARRAIEELCAWVEVAR